MESCCLFSKYCLFGFSLFLSLKGLKYFKLFYNNNFIKTIKQERNKLKQERKQINLFYDPLNCLSLKRFQLLSKKSECIFAKNAIIWGCLDFNEDLSLSENIQKLIPSILKFITLADEGEKLDGYVIEIKGSKYCKDLTSFTATVRQTLEYISKYDPIGLDVMKMKSISSSSWYYSLCNVPIFITTFAPFYSKNNCRYMHSIEELSDYCYILLQPEISFLRHNIGNDTPKTNWDNPETIRDKIRVNFRNHSRGYFIPPTISYPISEMIVIHPDSNENSGCPIKIYDKQLYPNID